MEFYVKRLLHESNDSGHTVARNRMRIRTATSLYTEQLIITRFGIKYNRRGVLLLASFVARLRCAMRKQVKAVSRCKRLIDYLRGQLTPEPALCYESDRLG